MQPNSVQPPYTQTNNNITIQQPPPPPPTMTITLPSTVQSPPITNIPPPNSTLPNSTTIQEQVPQLNQTSLQSTPTQRLSKYLGKIDCNCTICSSPMICPRIYEKCGHTFCEECMMKSDELDNNNNKYIFESTKYRCPLCRSTTLKPWYKRPFNHILITLLEKNTLYSYYEKKRIAQRKIDMKEIDNIDIEKVSTVNFSKLSYDYRDNKADELYEFIVPVIYNAVREGKPYIIITDRAREIKTVADIVSNKLIKNNNIYRTVSTNEEFTVEIIPVKSNMRYDYVNQNFADNLEDSDDEIEVPINTF
tara:strand:+ start:957 stop:1874 length:918 start_codon:yes stop_codon:yes gene_type:complete